MQHLIRSNVDTPLVLVTIACITSLVVASPLVALEKRTLCTKNMPCMWAVCPWSRHSRISPEYDANCVHIPNEACRCRRSTVCTLVPSMDPIAIGSAPYIKYEYLCALEDDSAYDSYYTLGKHQQNTLNK